MNFLNNNKKINHKVLTNMKTKYWKIKKKNEMFKY